MAKQRDHRRPPATPTPFEEARDELFQHIMRCGVIGAEAEDQAQWFADTVAYLEERFPELDARQLAEIRTLGERFAQPPKTRTTAADAASAA
jgi:hypothetical protein